MGRVKRGECVGSRRARETTGGRKVGGVVRRRRNEHWSKKKKKKWTGSVRGWRTAEEVDGRKKKN